MLNKKTLLHLLWVLPLLLPAAAAQDVEVYIEPYDYVDEVVLKELDKATSSVALAYYNISLPTIREKLVQLKNAGVQVKVLVDARHSNDGWSEQLEQQGVPVRRVPNIRSSYAALHNKYVLIDGKTVIAGSGNLSSTGTQSNHENALLIRSASVAQKYQAELAETEAIADYMESVFTVAEMKTFLNTGTYPSWWPQKKQQILNKIWGMDKPTGNQPVPWIRTYFSPDDQCHKKILAELNLAKSEVFVAVFSFTRKDLAQKLASLAAAGVRVEVVTDENQANSGAMSEVNQIFATANIKHVKARNWNAFFAAMHHKFCVIDDKVVIMGAYNWSYAGSSQNDENLQIVQSQAVARRYEREFVSLMAKYDPTFQASKYDWNDFHWDLPDVAFVCTQPNTQPGDTVCVVGNLPQLGAWDPQKAVPLRTGNSTFPSWIGAVRLPAGSYAEFKFILRHSDGSVEWESGSNRSWTIPVEGHSFIYKADFQN